MIGEMREERFPPNPPQFESREEALRWIEVQGANVLPNMPAELTQSELQRVADELNKLPDTVLARLKANEMTIEFVADTGITVSPKYADLKGKRPRGWGRRATWDSVPGIGGERGVTIVANRIGEGHGSVNLLLHETAHTWERSFAKDPDFGIRLSESSAWRSIWKATKKNPPKWWARHYEGRYPEEALAESFAHYLNSKEGPQAVGEAIASFFKEFLAL